MEHAERHKIDSSKTMAVEEFVSYVDTWSAMNTWRKSSPEAATAALAQLKQEYGLCACCVQMSVRAVRPRERERAQRAHIWVVSSYERLTNANSLMRIWPNPDHSLDVHFEITLLLGRPTV